MPAVQVPLWLVLGCLLLAVPLLFIGGPDHNSTRLVKLLWDLGHIPLMFFFGLLLIKCLSLWVRSYALFFCVYFSVIAVIALGTEFIQSKIGRIASLTDVMSDVWGALLAWVFVGWYPPLRSAICKSLLTMMTLGLGVAVLLKPIMVFYDEVLVRMQFPLLSGFEHYTELSRWSAKTELIRSTDRASEGQYSLKVPLLPKGYSGVHINDFPANWLGFDALQFDVWSPLPLLSITVRVHDKDHRHQEYSDRFNQRHSLVYGWNRIKIDLNDVRYAPKGRELKLDEVEGFGFFCYNLGSREVVYVDKVVLLHDN